MPQQLNILIVEDEYFIADELARAVGEEGITVIGPAPTVDQARILAESNQIDFVLLDLNLGGEDASVLADWFRARNTPVTIVSGYERAELPASLAALPFIQKPMSRSSFVQMMDALRDRQSSGADRNTLL